MEAIICDRSLQGVHLLSKRKGVELQAYFSRKDHLARALDAARDSGVRSLYCTSQPLLLELLKSDPDRWPFRVFAVVPNFARFVRDTSHYGTTGAAVRRILAMPFFHKLRLAGFALAHPGPALGMRFELMMNLFLLAEASAFLAPGKDGGRLRLRALVLHQQIADLSLSLGQKGLFRIFSRMARAELGLEAGAATSNDVRLSEFLEDSPGLFDWFFSPFNPRGHLMHPGRSECEEALRRRGSAPARTVADVWCLGGTLPFAESLDYIASLPFAGALIDIADLLHAEHPQRIHSIQAI